MEIYLIIHGILIVPAYLLSRDKNSRYWTIGERTMVIFLCLVGAPLAVLVGGCTKLSELKFWDKKAKW